MNLHLLKDVGNLLNCSGTAGF